VAGQTGEDEEEEEGTNKFIIINAHKLCIPSKTTNATNFKKIPSHFPGLKFY
jgi:hypothetical protein